MLCEQEVARERKGLASRMWVNGDVGPGSDYSEGWKLIESGERKKRVVDYADTPHANPPFPFVCQLSK